MGSKTDFFENMMIDAVFRGGCLTSAGAAGSTAVVKGIWTATTSYSIGDIVVPHANMTGAGGKLLLCVIAQNSGSTNSLAIGNPGATVTDNSAAMWMVLPTMPVPANFYVGLFTVTPSDSAAGTEVTGGSYARVAVANSLANWAGTQSTGSTTASTGTGGATSNNAAITFAAPTADWGVVVAWAVFFTPTGGSPLYWGAISPTQTVSNHAAAPSFAIAALSVSED